jgi:hypothetical protein
MNETMTQEQRLDYLAEEFKEDKKYHEELIR